MLINFIDISDFSKESLRDILEVSKELKLKNRDTEKPLSGRNIILLFQKPSTRTRVSFEVGVNQLGGSAVILNESATQISRGESLFDTLRVLERYSDMVIIRNDDHKAILEFSKNSKIPIINALTDKSHPCQVMADILTYEEHRSSIEDSIVAWIGDNNNVTKSWIDAAAVFGFNLRIASPEKYQSLKSMEIVKNNKNIMFTDDPAKAAKDADLVVTDTWFSMGDKNNEYKEKLLASYQVNDQLMQSAKKEALFMHCLPAYIGKEVSSSVMEGKNSVVFDEAENRLHIQKSIMLHCFKISM